jgi:hypothetical protein
MTPHKYWRATVNGTPAELRPVNIGYQGIELPAGRHTIELAYRNPLVVPSMIVSLIAVMGIIVGCVVFPKVPLPAEVAPIAAEVGGAPQRQKRKRRSGTSAQV